MFSVFEEMCAATSLQWNPHHRAHSRKNTAGDNLRDNPASNTGLYLGGFKDALSWGPEHLVLILASGKYYRPDLNFPYSLPRRRNGIKDFENDPPLSSCGIFQSRMAGTCGDSCRDHSRGYH